MLSRLRVCLNNVLPTLTSWITSVWASQVLLIFVQSLLYNFATMNDYRRSVICHLFLFPCRACDSGVSITIKVSNQCRKPKAPIRILQIFHLKQPLWATEWFWNCWCTPHEEGAAVDTGLMSSLVLTIWKWVYYKTLKKANIIYVPQIWDMRLNFRHLHHIKIPKSISCFGGRGREPEKKHQFGQVRKNQKSEWRRI